MRSFHSAARPPLSTRRRPARWLGVLGRLLLLAWIALAAAGCGAHGGAAGKGGKTLPLPAELDARGYGELVRAFRKLATDDPQRTEVRARLVRYQLRQAEHARAANEYDAVVSQLAKMAELYRPAELSRGLLPELYP